ncbi:hypothetical protein LX36DRAFT_231349 [Colletotrichum falcatum]|nr:hypothetical protein LX36DRAFT_231349 [Colletotrichum falcatum]
MSCLGLGLRRRRPPRVPPAPAPPSPVRRERMSCRESRLAACASDYTPRPVTRLGKKKKEKKEPVGFCRNRCRSDMPFFSPECLSLPLPMQRCIVSVLYCQCVVLSV